MVPCSRPNKYSSQPIIRPKVKKTRQLTKFLESIDSTHFYPYTRTKAQAEVVLEGLAKNSSTELIVARPSIIIGHSQLGCSASGSIFFAIRALHKMGRVAWPLEYKIDIVPIDWVTESLSTLLWKNSLSSGRYHLSAGFFFFFFYNLIL